MSLSSNRRMRAGLMLMLCFAVFTSCARSQGSGSQREPRKFRFVSGHSARNIPFQEDDGHIFLQVRINNSAPLWFGLDTGATRSSIDQRVAQSLGLKSAGSQQVGGAGGYEEASIFNGVSIKLPGVELVDQTVWGLPLEFLPPATGRRIDGIIGYELFKNFVVDIDYAGLLINLHDPTKYDYRGSGKSVPLKVQPDGAIYVQARLNVAGREPLEGEFVIDTGGNGSLMLARTFVEQHRLLEAVKPTIPAGGGGVGGPIQIVFGRIKSLQFGDFVFNSPLTGLVKAGEIADAGKAGNIGGKCLRRFRIIFEYSRGRMTLEPNAYFALPDEFDMSGVALAGEGPDLSQIKVLRVRPNSPASEAGLLIQDLIEAVDGQPIRELARIKQLFRQDGREYLLTVKRAEQRLQLKIKLRRLI